MRALTLILIACLGLAACATATPCECCGPAGSAVHPHPDFFIQTR
jgi:hypothetical protein